MDVKRWRITEIQGAEEAPGMYNRPLFWLPRFIPMGACGDLPDATSAGEVDEVIAGGFAANTVELVAYSDYTEVSVYVRWNFTDTPDQVVCVVDRAPMPATPQETVDFARMAVRLGCPRLGHRG